MQRDDAQLHSARLDFCVSDITTRLNAGNRMWVSDIKCTFNFIDFSENKSIKSSKCVILIPNPHIRTYRPTILVTHTNSHGLGALVLQDSHVHGRQDMLTYTCSSGTKTVHLFSQTMGLFGCLFL